jgi:hypothetical protein
LQRRAIIIATGRGSRQMCRVDKYGFPRTKAKQFKRVHGFQSGDMVKAVVPTGKKAGVYIGRVAVRTSGSFNLFVFSTPNPKVLSSPTTFGLMVEKQDNLKTENATIQGINYRRCRLLQRADGYSYEQRGTALPPYPLNG